MTQHQEMLKRLSNHKQIVFGPIIGSLELETAVWAGFIRQFKLNNPDKEIIVLTRSSRRDLYYGCIDTILEFDIPYEGEKFVASGHTLRYIGSDALTPINTDEIEKYLLGPAIKKFPNAHYESICKIAVRDAFLFGNDKLDTTFMPYPENFEELHKSVRSSADSCWIIVDPFSEINNVFAQWDIAKWTIFFKQLSLLPVTIFIPDPDGITTIPDKAKLIDLKAISDNYRCTYIGTLIEAIRISDAVFGTGGIPKVLADFANIPYIHFNYNSNPVNIVQAIENQIKSKFETITKPNSEELKEAAKAKLIETNFSNNQGSNHPNNQARKASGPLRQKSHVFRK